jgi:hypothetical protein
LWHRCCILPEGVGLRTGTGSLTPCRCEQQLRPAAVRTRQIPGKNEQKKPP